MNYEAERAMNQKRLRMEGEAHGAVQGNGLPLNYMDNGHQIPYQPYAGAYNTHYPPPEFSAYGPPPPPPPGGYAPQNLSYAPPAHQNYPHHQPFPPQQQPLHMPTTHMVQGYGGGVGVGGGGGGGAAPDVHKWAPQHLLPAPAHDAPPPDKLKPEIKLEPADTHKRTHPADNDVMVEIEQPKIKIKTDIFKPDDSVQQAHIEKDEVKPEAVVEKVGEKPSEVCKMEAPTEAAGGAAAAAGAGDTPRATDPAAGDVAADTTLATRALRSDDGGQHAGVKSQSSPGAVTPAGQEPKKRGRPKGSTNKPKAAGAPGRVLTPNAPTAPAPLRAGAPPTPQAAHARGGAGMGRPRGTGYQYAVRPFRKDFSGIQFRRRWSDDGLDSSHIPNEVYFGDVPVSTEVLFNYYDAGAERERLAAQAAQVAAQKAAAAKLATAKLQARGLLTGEVTTVDSSSSDSTSGSSDSDSSSEDDNTPLKKRAPGRPRGSKSATPRRSSSSSTPGGGAARRGRPPVPPELREPGITDVKKFCKAAGVRFDYKKLVEGCTKNKERVGRMMELLVKAGLEGKPTLEKCRALKQAKLDARDSDKRKKQQAKAKTKEEPDRVESNVPRRMTRGATGTKPRQKIVISSEEEDDTPDARRTLSKLRSMVEDESASE